MATKPVLKEDDVVLGTPTYAQAKLGLRFATLVNDYVELKERIREFEKDKARLNDKIFAQLAATGLQRVLVNEYAVSIVDSDRTTLNKEKLYEKLLGLGLAANDVNCLLEQASTTSHSAYLRVDTRKSKEE